MALGVHVTPGSAPPSRGVPTATDPWFVAGLSPVGDIGEANKVESLAQFELLYGPRTGGNITLWDALDVFFREGGARAFVSVQRNEADLDDALAAMIPTLGPGQLSTVGYAVSTANAALIAADAQAKNRFGLIDLPTTYADGDPVSELVTYTDAVKAADPQGYTGVFGSTVKVPPAAGVAGGTARTVQASAVIAALCCRVDETGNPNQAAAGRWLPLQYVQSLDIQPSMAYQDTALDAGVNFFAEIYGVLENYGFQTTVVQSENTPFWQANCSRTRMAMVAGAQAIGENFMFKTIDGQGALAASLKGSLDAMCLDLYSGELFGGTAAEAFRNNVGPTVNTIDSISQGKLRAVCTAILSLHAKAVEIELVSVPVGGTV